MRGLIFGTVYADTAEKLDIARMWVDLHSSLSAGCDLLLVDSSSPLPVVSLPVAVHNTGENIGHLSRGGQDGWGRAFCAGLRLAVTLEYDYVAHVECDSMFRISMDEVFASMEQSGILVGSVPVRGTRRLERDWVETGLMTFDVSWLAGSRLVDRYDWQNGDDKRYPRTPEWHMHQIVESDLTHMPWVAERGDQNQIGPTNVEAFDWITHVSTDTLRAFSRSARKFHGH